MPGIYIIFFANGFQSKKKGNILDMWYEIFENQGMSTRQHDYFMDTPMINKHAHWCTLQFFFISWIVLTNHNKIFSFLSKNKSEIQKIFNGLLYNFSKMS